jgi:hypothetical protein
MGKIGIGFTPAQSMKPNIFIRGLEERGLWIRLKLIGVQ